jgi:putative endonuclease
MLLSKHKDKLISYVGYTNNLNYRLSLHNSSKGAKFTKGKKWSIIYKKIYPTKSSAMKGEYKLKKDYKLRNKIKNIYISK